MEISFHMRIYFHRTFRTWSEIEYFYSIINVFLYCLDLDMKSNAAVPGDLITNIVSEKGKKNWVNKNRNQPNCAIFIYD